MLPAISCYSHAPHILTLVPGLAWVRLLRFLFFSEHSFFSIAGVFFWIVHGIRKIFLKKEIDAVLGQKVLFDYQRKIKISNMLNSMGLFVGWTFPLWKKLGDVETRLLRKGLSGIAVRRPVFITGLARSGSTILLEVLNSCQNVVTHKYRDYPMLCTPYSWNKLINPFLSKKVKETERAHFDRIMISREHPESMEEVLWMKFFRSLHDPSNSNVLDETVRNASFERFYREHIAKLLLLRGGERYVSKGNYLISRIKYLLKIFPDAQFVIPVRHPTTHVASLMKQHAIFSREEHRDPRILGYMKRVGHYEFGKNRAPINLGNNRDTSEIVDLWNSVDEVRGWARYWSAVYSYLFALLQEQPLADHCTVVRYEDLCNCSETALERLFGWCDLDCHENTYHDWTEKLSLPSYYEINFSVEDTEIIREETEKTALLFGYNTLDSIASHSMETP